MTCRYCGKKVPDDAAFCPSCGKRTEAHLRREKTESHLRKDDDGSHLRKEDRDKDTEKREKKKQSRYYEEPAGKRRIKSFISIIAAILFVVAAFIAVMVFVKPYLGEEPWPDEKTAETETDNIGFPKNMYIAAEDGLLLYEEPGTESKAIHLLNYGREIQVEKIEEGWAYTTVDGLSGWCSAENLTENADEIRHDEIKPKSDAEKGQLAEPSRRIVNGYHGTVNSEDGLNLRCGPGEDYDILMVVPYKTEVIEEGWNDGWIFVNYDGQYGWVRSEYITPTGEVEK